MLVAVPLAFLSMRRANPVLRFLDIVIEAPWVVPGTVVALGMILAFLKPLPMVGVSIYGTMAILVIAYLAELHRRLNFSGDLGKHLGALLILTAFAVLDVREFGMACHGRGS